MTLLSKRGEYRKVLRMKGLGLLKQQKKGKCLKDIFCYTDYRCAVWESIIGGSDDV